MTTTLEARKLEEQIEALKARRNHLLFTGQRDLAREVNWDLEAKVKLLEKVSPTQGELDLV